MDILMLLQYMQVSYQTDRSYIPHWGKKKNTKGDTNMDEFFIAAFIL